MKAQETRHKTKRQKIEEKFHDKWAVSTKLSEIKVSENFSLAAQENRYAKKVLGPIKNKKILDLGCGYGETAVYWALGGADVQAIDISSKMISLAKKIAQKNGVSNNCHFKQMVAEKLDYPDNYFDFVFGNGVLHHVDLKKSIKEVVRVLKKGGKAIFVEPLAYNPVIDIYRQIADEVRTPDEKPLKFKHIEEMGRSFNKVSHKEYQLCTLLIFGWFFLVSRVNPNSERYWKKILRVKGTQKTVLKFLIGLDSLVLKFIHPLRYLCWNTVIILEK